MKTVGFGELYEEAKAQHGTVFEEAYEMERERILRNLAAGRINMIEGNFQLIEKIYDSKERHSTCHRFPLGCRIVNIDVAQIADSGVEIFSG